MFCYSFDFFSLIWIISKLYSRKTSVGTYIMEYMIYFICAIVKSMVQFIRLLNLLSFTLPPFSSMQQSDQVGKSGGKNFDREMQ